MPASARLVGSSGSFLTTALLFGSIAALWPVARHCRYWECRRTDVGSGAEIPVDASWRPFIANPGTAPWSADPYPPCPEPQATGYRFSLEDAPLPSGFDPLGTRKPMFACVLVGPNGEVLEARLLGTGAETARAALLRTIRHWRFVPTWWEDSPAAAWQRVRLDRGSTRAEILEPLLLD